MRIAVLAAIAAAGVGLLAMSAASAAPVYGTAIGSTAANLNLMQEVQWRRRYHHRRFCYRHPYRCY
jgi:hypothetical protein